MVESYREIKLCEENVMEWMNDAASFTEIRNANEMEEERKIWRVLYDVRKCDQHG